MPAGGRPTCASYADGIPSGANAAWPTSWSVTAWTAPGPTSIYRALVRNGLSSPGPVGAPRPTTGAGSGTGPWSCGSWTSWAASGSSRAAGAEGGDRPGRPLPVLCHGRAGRGDQPAASAGSSPRPWPARAPEESSPTTARSSPAGSAPHPGRGASTASPRTRDHPPAHRVRCPTTTGKIEHFHKTLRAELLTGRRFDSLAHAQRCSTTGWTTTTPTGHTRPSPWSSRPSGSNPPPPTPA